MSRPGSALLRTRRWSRRSSTPSCARSTCRSRSRSAPAAIREHRNALAIARIAEDAGIRALAVHGRTRACAYVGPVEYDTIRAVKAAVAIPVIANGDIATPEKAKRVLDYTGADAIMIGRAAQGRPWIFREIGHFLDWATSCRRRRWRKCARRSSSTWRTSTPSTARTRACASRASISAGTRRISPAAMRSAARSTRRDERGAARDGPPTFRCARRKRRASRLPRACRGVVDARVRVRPVTTEIATGREALAA